MNETPPQKQSDYDPSTLPYSDNQTLFHLAQMIDTYFNATEYPFTQQFTEAAPHHQYSYDPSTEPNSNCSPSSYLGQGSYKNIKYSTSSMDPMQYEASAHTTHTDNQLNKNDSDVLSYLETNELKEFNEHQEFKENHNYQQTQILYQNQESNHNQDGLFDQTAKFQQNQPIEQSHTSRRPEELKKDFQRSIYQQNQDSDQHLAFYPANSLFDQTAQFQQNQLIEQSQDSDQHLAFYTANSLFEQTAKLQQSQPIEQSHTFGRSEELNKDFQRSVYQQNQDSDQHLAFYPANSLFDQTAKFQQNQPSEQSHTFRRREELKKDFQRKSYQQNQDSDQYHAFYTANSVFEQTAKFQQNQSIEQSHTFGHSEESKKDFQRSVQQNQGSDQHYAFYTAKFKQTQSIEQPHSLRRLEELTELLVPHTQKIPSESKSNIKKIKAKTNNKREEGKSNQLLFRCVPCGRVFSRAGSLSVHYNANHSDRHSFRCRRCSKKFTSDDKLNAHFKKHCEKHCS